MVAKIEDSVQHQWRREATMSIRFLARESMVAALTIHVNDRVTRQQGQRGRHNNQINAMVVKMAINWSGVGSEDGL
jgi:hypothetical protein